MKSIHLALSALNFLADHGPTCKHDLFEHLKASPHVRDLAPDKGIVLSNGLTKWQNELDWILTSVVHEGLMVKNGRGIWFVPSEKKATVRGLSENALKKIWQKYRSPHGPRGKKTRNLPPEQGEEQKPQTAKICINGMQIEGSPESIRAILGL